jgi:hypothetical protein
MFFALSRLNACSIRSILRDPKRTLLLTRRSTILIPELSIWLSAIAPCPLAVLHALTAARSSVRLPALRVVPGTRSVLKPSRLMSTPAVADHGSSVRPVQSTPSVTSHGSSTDPLATTACRRSPFDGPHSSDGSNESM